MSRLAASALALLFAGCAGCAGDATGAASSGPVRLELLGVSPSAAPGLTATVAYRLRNTSGEPVAIPRCGEALLVLPQRRAGGAWTEPLPDLCNANVSMVPLALAGGGSVQGVAPVVEAGRYRLRVSVAGLEGDDGRQVVTSREFDAP